MRRYRRRRPISRRAQVLLSIAAGLGLAILVVVQLSARLRPAVITAASDYLDNQVSDEIYQVVNQAILQDNITYDSIYTIVTGADGSITALQADLTRLNQICSDVSGDVAQAFSNDFISEKIDLPIGTLFGCLNFFGEGPQISVTVLSAGNVNAEYENAFASVGINQTRHQVLLHVTAELNLLLPGGVYTWTSEYRIILAETILLGNVPDSYAYFDQTSTEAEAYESYYHYIDP